MACGCTGNNCNCVITGGPGITVSGAGTTSNPFVISGIPVTCNCHFQTSTTISVSGTGSSGSPWTASVIVDPVGGLQTGASGVGILIDPASTLPWSLSAAGLKLDCCPPSVLDSSSIDFSVTGGAVTGDVVIHPTGGLQTTGSGVGIKIDPASPAPISVSAAGLSVGCCSIPLPGVQAFTASGNISATGGKFVTFTGPAGQTLTLPAATPGLEFDIMNIDTTDSVTISRAGSDTINPAALTTIVIPAGGRASFICIATGVWNCSLSATVSVTSGGIALTSTAFATAVSLSLGPGKWALSGKAFWDVSTAVARTYVARLFNVTAGVEIDRHENFISSVVMKSAVKVQERISLTTTSTIAFQAAPSAVDGTQLFQDPVLIATAIDG